MKKHGIFISYRHTDWALAGRIYDFLKTKGLHPFWDSTSMYQGSFPETLEREILQAPYFLCVLTPNTFGAYGPNDFVCKEIEIALSCPGKKILLVADDHFSWPESMPESIAKIKQNHYDTVTRNTFLPVMEHLFQRNIDKNMLSDTLDWKQMLLSSSNTFLSKREHIERSFATLSNRFGAELLQSIQENREYDGENRIRFIHMSCYAASIIFSPQQDMVDERAFDLGKMFSIFAWLLRDPAFNLELVINAPGCHAMHDAIEQKKLGNSALEVFPEAIFLSSYCNIQRLIQEHPVFSKAYKEKRFRFLVTESVLPYSIFQIAYKPEYDEYDHIKVDLYSEGLTSNMDRRCMVIFKKDDPDNYTFFSSRYEYIRNPVVSKKLIKQYHTQWTEQWEQLKEELE